MCDVDALVKLLVASSDLALHMQVCVSKYRDIYITHLDLSFSGRMWDM